MHWRQWDLNHMVVKVYRFVISEIKALNLNLGGWGARMWMVFFCSGSFIGFGKALAMDVATEASEKSGLLERT